MGIPALDENTYLDLDHAGLASEQEEQYWPHDSTACHLLRSRRVVATARNLEALSHLAINCRLVVTATSRFTQQAAALSPWLVSIPAPAAFTPIVLVGEAPSHRQSEPAVQWLIRQVEIVANDTTPGGLEKLRAG
jgi:hypothetical protein